MKRVVTLFFALLLPLSLAACAPGWFEHSRRAYDLTYQNKNQEALEEFTRAIALNPKAAHLYAARGRVYRGLNDDANAIKDFTRALELEPGAFGVHFERGQLYAKSFQFDKALADYNAAIEKRKLARFVLNRGLLYMILHEYDLAREDFEFVVDQEPNTAVAYYNLGLIDLQDDDAESAIENLELALLANPEYMDATVALGDAYLKKGDAAQAQCEYQQACDMGNLLMCDEVKQMDK